MGKRAISVYSYLDHQEYLRAWFSHQVSEHPHCSLQWLAGKLGVRSKGHVHRILHDSSRPMSRVLMERWIQLLQLSPSESEYFRAMVAFYSSSRPEDRAHSFSVMHRALSVRESGRILADRYEYLSCWWLPALREVAIARKWGIHDIEAMGKVFLPPLTSFQVRKGLELLVRTGLLVEESAGVYRQAEPVIRTDTDILDIAIYNFHKEQLERSREALERPVGERELAGITFGLPAGSYLKLRDRIREFQTRLLEEFGGEPCTPQEILQLNLQLFHLTQPFGTRQ